MNVCVSTEKNSPISPARTASFADPCHQTQGWVRALRRRAQSSPIRVVAFFFVKDKITASTTRNHWCRSAPNTSLNKRTSPSLGEFANMERHLHNQTATTFPEKVRHVADSRGNNTLQKLVCLNRVPPHPLRPRPPTRTRPPFASQLSVLSVLRSSCFLQSNTIRCAAWRPAVPFP